MTRINPYLFWLLAVSHFIVLNSSAAFIKTKNPTSPIDIPLNLSAKDKRNNIQLQPKFTVISVSEGNIIPLKEIDGRVTVFVKSGESYKITAQLDGYYNKEKIQNIATDQDKEGFNVVLDMEPQPSASLILKAIDDATGDYVDATFTVTNGDKIYTGKTGKGMPYYRIVVTKADLYTVEVNTDSHKPKRESFSLEIGDPARSYNKEIRLEKPISGVKILIIGQDTKKIVKGVALKIINTSDNQPFFNSTLPEGEALIEFDPTKKYFATIEQEGYVPLKIDLKVANQKELVLTMPSESFFSLGAFDKLSGRRLSATFKISYKEIVQEIKGTADADIKFKPSENGIYMVEVSHPNYTTKKEPFNIENLDAGKLIHKILLESTVDEYVILVVDGEDKQMIQGADVKIFDDSKQNIPVKINPKTGEYRIILEKNKDYFLEVEAGGYMKQTGTLQRSTSKLIGINLQKVFQTIFYSAIDGITKKPIEGNYKLLRANQEPLIGTSDSNKQYKIDVLPQRKYVLEISANGYKTITENPSFDTKKTEKDNSRIIELQRDSYAFVFKVIDAQKKQPLGNAKLSILQLSTNQPVGTTNNKSIFSTNLLVADSYKISVEAEGYEKNIQTIDVRTLAANSQFEQEIPLFKNTFDKIRLLIEDEEKGGNVSNANIKIFNSLDEPIMVIENPLSAEWLSELKNNERYRIEITAEGYLPYKNDLTKDLLNNKTYKIKIKKIPSKEIFLLPIDALTKKGIVSTFKITTGNEIINGTLMQGGTKMKVTLMQDKTYEIELIASNYQPFKDTVSLVSAIDGTITILLKKDFYDLNFKVFDAQTKQIIQEAELKLSGEDKQPITPKFNTETRSFQSSLKPDEEYTIHIEAQNYETYSENIKVTNLASSTDFQRDFFMVKKEVIKEIAKEIVKKTEPEDRIETPKSTEKKLQVNNSAEKKEAKASYIDNATVITDEDFDIKVEIFENLGIGKRFRLSNLYFEQSSSEIKPQSFSQLNKLVNTMKLNPRVKLEIVGYTDSNGDPRLNLSLSHFRATVVSNYLFNKGIAASRIKAAGKGQEEPIAPNDTEENRTKNRRVEFVITEN